MRVVLDCNVLISAGLNAGVCRTMLREVVAAHQCVLSAEILREYVTVARRERFAAAQSSLIGLIEAVSSSAVLVTPAPAGFSLPDPQDQPYLDAAVAAGAAVLITGNKKHFPAPEYAGVRIVSPKEFLELSREHGHPR